ncbi:MAG: hypothetical protein WBK91_01990 [Alphaproteobacteria bacterium]
MTSSILSNGSQRKKERQVLSLNHQLFCLFEGKDRTSPARHAKLNKVAENMVGILESGAEGSRSWIMPLLVVANALAENPAYRTEVERASRVAAAHAYFDPVIERGAINLWRGIITKMKTTERMTVARVAIRSSKTNTLFKEVSQRIVKRHLIDKAVKAAAKVNAKREPQQPAKRVIGKRRQMLQARS